MQKVRYEQFHFSFIGEGGGSDSIGWCYTSGKPALVIPSSYRDRAMRQVADNEIVIASPPGEIDRVITRSHCYPQAGQGAEAMRL